MILCSVFVESEWWWQWLEHGAAAAGSWSTITVWSNSQGSCTLQYALTQGFLMLTNCVYINWTVISTSLCPVSGVWTLVELGHDQETDHPPQQLDKHVHWDLIKFIELIQIHNKQASGCLVKLLIYQRQDLLLCNSKNLMKPVRLNDNMSEEATYDWSPDNIQFYNDSSHQDLFQIFPYFTKLSNTTDQCI